MRRKGSRNEYCQQRIPAEAMMRLAASGRRVLEFQIAGETVRKAVTGQTKSIKFSLRTSDPVEVKVRQAEAARQAELHWKALRQTEPVTLSHRQCVALAGRAYQAWADGERETTAAMVWVPVQGKPGEPAREGRWEPAAGRTMDGEPEAWAEAVRSVNPEKLGALADRLLVAEGIGGVDDASREMLLNEIAKALRQAFEARQRNAEGDYGLDPMAGRFPEFQGQQQKGDDARESRVSRSSSPPKVSLIGLVEDWWREAKAGGMSLSTYESYRNTARKFGAFLKHDDAGRVSAEDVLRFKDWRIANGVSPWTVKANDIAGLRTLFAWGVANRRLTANPAEGVKVAGSKRPKMRDRGFTDEEAGKLLAQASRYVAPKAEHPKMAALKRWAAWLSAYTGARVGEIVQLRKQDVRREAGLGGRSGDAGIIVVTITPEAGRVKTKEVREVVLHEHLEAMGFWQFVEKSRAGYLFLNVQEGEDWRGKWRAAKNTLACCRFRGQAVKLIQPSFRTQLG